MLPTLEPGDRLMANKWLTLRRLDLVAFHSPQEDGEIYCKRLLGKPGDRLRFQAGKVYLNSEQFVLPGVLPAKECKNNEHCAINRREQIAQHLAWCFCPEQREKRVAGFNEEDPEQHMLCPSLPCQTESCQVTEEDCYDKNHCRNHEVFADDE